MNYKNNKNQSNYTEQDLIYNVSLEYYPIELIINYG